MAHKSPLPSRLQAAKDWLCGKNKLAELYDNNFRIASQFGEISGLDVLY